MTRTFFILGALFGMLGVIAGAFGAHALRAHLAPERMAQFEIAVRYQMYHAFAKFVAAWAVQRWGGAATAAGWLFVVGIVIFSGTVYALSFGSPRWFGAITPIGGLCLILGWAALALSAWRAGV
jgi:uncharacterized membrane protein YgdD (TMEM256/DUF423 family)